jgi:hypothetical protein
MVIKNKYNAKRIEEEFKEVARARIRGKERGRQEYAGDAGYWNGGRCEWGGSHNLREDCETLARLFDKLTNLKEVKKKLTTFANEEQFNDAKQKLIKECEQIIENLDRQNQHDYIAGICIIWSDFKSHIDDLKTGFVGTVNTLKRDIEKVHYDEAKELKALEIEESQIKQEIEDNERKAANETDPTKKHQFFILVDEGKAKWKKIIEKKKKLKISGLGENYDSDKFIENFIQGIKDKIGGNKPPRNPFKTPDDDEPDTPSKPKGKSPNPLDPFVPNPNQNPLQNNQQLLIFAGFALLVMFFFLNQKPEKPTPYYDF